MAIAGPSTETAVANGFRRKRSESSDSDAPQGLSPPLVRKSKKVKLSDDEEHHPVKAKRKKKKNKGRSKLASSSTSVNAASEDVSDNIVTAESHTNNSKKRRKKARHTRPKHSESVEICDTKLETERNSPVQGSKQSLLDVQGSQGARSPPTLKATWTDRDAERLRLRLQLADNSSLLQAHTSLLKKILGSLTCQVCLDPMTRPFSLSPCGHAACFNCLTSWFRSLPPHTPTPVPASLQAHLDPENPHLLKLNSLALLRKPKTCPHCRARIREQPAEAWGLKDISALLRNSRLVEGFCDSNIQSANHLPTEPGKGLWHGIFYNHDSSGAVEIPITLEDPNSQTIPAGAHPPNGHTVTPSAAGFYDHEDSVFRCLDCFHEIWEGVCSNCERVYPLHGEVATGDEIMVNGETVYAGGFHWWSGEPPLPNSGVHNDFADDLQDIDDDLLSNDDDGYESSFIDDDDHHHLNFMFSNNHSSPPSPFQNTIPFPHQPSPFFSAPSGPSRSARRSEPYLVTLSSDEEDDAPGPSTQSRSDRSSRHTAASSSDNARSRPTRHRPAVIISESEDEDEDDTEEDEEVVEVPHAPVSRNGTRTSRRVIQSEDEHDSDSDSVNERIRAELYRHHVSESEQDEESDHTTRHATFIDEEAEEERYTSEEEAWSD